MLSPNKKKKEKNQVLKLSHQIFSKKKHKRKKKVKKKIPSYPFRASQNLEIITKNFTSQKKR